MEKVEGIKDCLLEECWYSNFMAKKKALPRWISEHVPDEIAESSVFRFKFKFRSGDVLDIDLLQDLDIDYEILEDHLETVSAQYMYWAAVYSEAKSNVSALEIQLKARRNSVARQVIERFKADNVKLTDKQLNSMIDSDKKLIEVEAKLAIAQKHTGKLYHMIEAIRIKSENCRSLAGFKRQDKEQSGHTT